MTSTNVVQNIHHPRTSLVSNATHNWRLFIKSCLSHTFLIYALLIYLLIIFESLIPYLKMGEDQMKNYEQKVDRKCIFLNMSGDM